MKNSKFNKNLRVAVVGIGYMGRNHARVLSSIVGADLVAISDVDVSKTEMIAKQYKINSYLNYLELFEKEKLDAVSICLPTSLHLEASMEALRRKIAVFVEKPICGTLEEAKKLISYSKKQRVAVMVGHIERFNPVVEEIRRRIGSGELGKIFKIQTQRFSPPQTNQKESVSIDLATHDIDIVLHLLDLQPERIYAESFKSPKGQNVLVTSVMKFKGGVIGVIEVGWLYPVKMRNLVVVGEKGMYIADYITQEFFFYRQNNRLYGGDDFFGPTSQKADVVKVAFETKEPLQVELEAFIGAVLKKSRMPVSAQEGLNSLTIAHKMDLSAKSGKAV